jgi:cyclophilin family peptidyl-prolyl cis-trans isomerase
MKSFQAVSVLGLLLLLTGGACLPTPPSTVPTTDDYLQALPQNSPFSDTAASTEQTTPAKSMLTATLRTNLGDIAIAFYPESPKTAANFTKLAKDGFYDGVRFHRVIDGFMIQTGDPNSKDNDWSNDGKGGPGYTFADEFNSHPLVRGSVAMANSGPDTNGSQFFIVTAESTPWLDGKHTNFGYVVSGMDVVDEIQKVKTNEQDHPLSDVTITRVTVQAAAD